MIDQYCCSNSKSVNINGFFWECSFDNSLVPRPNQWRIQCRAQGARAPPFLTSLNKTCSRSGCGLEQQSIIAACRTADHRLSIAMSRRSLVVDFWSWRARWFHPFLLSPATMYVILSSINPWSEKLHWLGFKKKLLTFFLVKFSSNCPLFQNSWIRPC